MTFFYDLNKRMAELANKQTLAEGKGAKPDFLDIDKDGNKKESMKKAVADKKEVDESALQAFIGKKKYGEQGMKALQQAGRDGADKEKMAKIRAQHDKVDEAEMDEGNEFSGELVKARAQGDKEFEVDGKKYTVTKESDVDEGNDFTGARLAAIRAGKPTFKVGNKTFRVTGDTSDEKTVVEKKEKVKAKNAFDLETAKKMFSTPKDKTSTGHTVQDLGYAKRYTKDLNDEPADSDEEKSSGPKKKGRPTGTKRAIGAKGPGVKSKLLNKPSIKEGTTDDLVTAAGILGKLVGRSSNGERIEPKELVTQLRQAHRLLSQMMGGAPVDTLRPETKPVAEDNSIEITSKGEYDQEGDMAKDQLHTMVKVAKELHSILGDDQNLPEWVQSKITKALDYINVANDYMDQEKHDSDNISPVAEKAVSKQQQKFMGMASAMQKGEKIKGASPELKKVAKTMKKGDVEDFAKTKHKGLPEKKKKEVDETTVAGSVATAPAAGGSKSKGGFSFGKGVYEGAIAESFEGKLKTVLSEGVSINMSVDETGKKNLNVTATDDDAMKLAQLLKLAGMEQVGGYQEACPSCGSSDCGCNSMSEGEYANSPEVEVSDTDTMINTLSGGLNGRKSTGQTTIPVIASQENRLHSMEESAQAENKLFDLYKAFKNS